MKWRICGNFTEALDLNVGDEMTVYQETDLPGSPWRWRVLAHAPDGVRCQATGLEVSLPVAKRQAVYGYEDITGVGLLPLFSADRAR